MSEVVVLVDHLNAMDRSFVGVNQGESDARDGLYSGEEENDDRVEGG